MIAGSLVCLLVGVFLVGLGVYFVPADARDIQVPFQEFGEPRQGTVVDKRTAQRSYEGGGRRGGGTKTYEELVVEVELEGRTVTIENLVLARDYEALQEGDDVDITIVRGKRARKALPRGPYYLLTSSVEAGTLDYLGWAFSGRPARPAAVLTVIPGIVFLIASFVLFSLRPRRKAAAALED